MKSFKDKLILGFMCTILGIVLAMQFRIVQTNYLGGGVPSQRLLELKSELKKAQEEKENLIKELDSYDKKLKEIEQSASEDSAIIKRLNDELEKYKEIGGFTRVKGPGIEMIIDDPPKELEYDVDGSIIMYRYDYLLRIINYLNSAGAEAISINGQRIIANTEIQLAGNSLQINSVPTAPPIIIKAIGDPDTLKSALDWRYGIVGEMRDILNLQVDIKKLDELEIDRYNDIVKYKLAKPADE
ncbi:DUF881 domain-containing protein [Paramaledivibacter caminithermalis]|uniref:Uncharacterized conserved protein YlxW, UPF0749 family n=1 Tax=Paramaledivibacter caminithermalis (strain DSM 15212 / CIP 107654 / DViRD3) TaxID=1121301 RepID=A0A1M6S179_PARC5|nr:DUF881 domain-containing protein [Paramaledivibacter caminithermalis]SHK38501.1 Uncharacterized conserved protein YlxW, UPF0749 family [Paramaledivibacter caminithermalis DSM 15212]